MSKNQNAHDTHDPNLPATFERLDHGAHAKGVQGGYPNEYQRMTARGRDRIAADAARRGIASFPPARLLGKAHKP